MARALIVNGDDFGLTPGVNAGVLQAHLGGILSSASLFANAPATDQAIDIDTLLHDAAHAPAGPGRGLRC